MSSNGFKWVKTGSNEQNGQNESRWFKLEWYQFCVFEFSRNAKDFDPFFEKFRENCEINKVPLIAYTELFTTYRRFFAAAVMKSCNFLKDSAHET